RARGHHLCRLARLAARSGGGPAPWMRESGRAMAEALVARNVWKSYRTESGELSVLQGLDLAVEKGEIVGIVGVSGVGKSTLLHVLGALDRPDQGEVLIGGTAVAGLSAGELAAVRARGA